VVEPACEVDMIAEVIDKEVDLVWRPAYDEATAHHQWGEDCVTTGRTHCWTARGINL